MLPKRKHLMISIKLRQFNKIIFKKNYFLKNLRGQRVFL